jgi:ketosteroid isomerase-like protein
MMRSNAEIAREAFEAIGRRRLDAALDFLDPEVEFEPPEDAIEHRGTFKGHKAVRERWNLLLEPFDEFEIEPDDFLEAPDGRVVVLFRVRGRGKASGAPVEMQLAHVVTLRDGKAVHLKAYLDPDEALRAVGLEPQSSQP